MSLEINHREKQAEEAQNIPEREKNVLINPKELVGSKDPNACNPEVDFFFLTQLPKKSYSTFFELWTSSYALHHSHPDNTSFLLCPVTSLVKSPLSRGICSGLSERNSSAPAWFTLNAFSWEWIIRTYDWGLIATCQILDNQCSQTTITTSNKDFLLSSWSIYFSLCLKIRPLPSVIPCI